MQGKGGEGGGAEYQMKNGKKAKGAVGGGYRNGLGGPWEEVHQKTTTEVSVN